MHQANQLPEIGRAAQVDDPGQIWMPVPRVILHADLDELQPASEVIHDLLCVLRNVPFGCRIFLSASETDDPVFLCVVSLVRHAHPPEFFGTEMDVSLEFTRPKTGNLKSIGKVLAVSFDQVDRVLIGLVDRDVRILIVMEIDFRNFWVVV